MNQTKELIPKKGKKTKLSVAKPVAETETQAEIPKDLANKWGAVEAIATTFNTMQKGTFTASYMTVLNASLSFLQKLHEQTVEDALMHPNADLIPELKTIKEEREKNGSIEKQ